MKATAAYKESKKKDVYRVLHTRNSMALFVVVFVVFFLLAEWKWWAPSIRLFSMNFVCVLVRFISIKVRVIVLVGVGERVRVRERERNTYWPSHSLSHAFCCCTMCPSWISFEFFLYFSEYCLQLRSSHLIGSNI